MTEHPNTAVPVLDADGPVLLFGGCYSNLQATQALLDEARHRGIPAERIVCTGDVVAYCADASATVALTRAAGIHVVMGNCEESLGADAADCGCGFTAGSACDLLSVAWYAHATATMDADARAWMRALPQRIDLQIGGRRLAIVHGSPGRINEFVFASRPDHELHEMIRRTGCDGVIGGHCGLPFTRVTGDRLWHNPGVIGVPANDGTPRVWFSVLTPGDQGCLIEHLPLEYDHAAAARAMRAAGLPTGYAEALETGLWPNTDILPEPETRETGRRLRPNTVRLAVGAHLGM